MPPTKNTRGSVIYEQAFSIRITLLFSPDSPEANFRKPGTARKPSYTECERDPRFPLGVHSSPANGTCEGVECRKKTARDRSPRPVPRRRGQIVRNYK